MGIGIKSGKSWWETVQKHRESRPCLCTKNPGKFCSFHGWQFSGCPQGLSNIKTTPQFESLLKAGATQYDERGNALPSTARGKRRRQRLGKQPHTTSVE